MRRVPINVLLSAGLGCFALASMGYAQAKVGLYEARVIREHWDGSQLFLSSQMVSANDQAFVVTGVNTLALLNTENGHLNRIVDLKPPSSCMDKVDGPSPVITINNTHAYWSSQSCGLVAFDLSSGVGQRLSIQGLPQPKGGYSALTTDDLHLYAAGDQLYEIDLGTLKAQAVLDLVHPKEGRMEAGCDLLGNAASQPSSISVSDHRVAVTSFETVALFSLTDGTCLANARSEEFPGGIYLDRASLWYRGELPAFDSQALFIASVKNNHDTFFESPVAFSTRLSGDQVWPPTSSEILGQAFSFGGQVAVAYRNGESTMLLGLSDSDELNAKSWECNTAFASFYDHGSGVFSDAGNLWSIAEGDASASVLAHCSEDGASHAETAQIKLDVPGIRALTTDAEGRVVGAFGSRGLRIIDLKTGQTQALLESENVYGVTRMSNGLLLLSLGAKGIATWDPKTRDFAKRYSVSDASICQAREAEENTILAVGACEDQGAASIGQKIWAIDTGTGASKKILSHSAADVYRLGRYMYVSDRSNHVSKFDYATGRLLGIISFPNSMAMGFAPLGSSLNIVTYTTETGPSDEKGWVSISL